MDLDALLLLVTNALEDMKAQNIQVIDVRGKTPLADAMVIASGTSNRHVASLANDVATRAKASGVQPLGVEGAETPAEWVLVDLNDIIVHVMLPKVREYYGLERLWLADAPAEADVADADPNADHGTEIDAAVSRPEWVERVQRRRRTQS